MSKHIYRKGIEGIDPLREWIRVDYPDSRDGLVVEDLDLAIRRYGPGYDLPAEGDLMLVSKKTSHETWNPNGGEARVLDWIDRAIKSSPMAKFWRGIHLLRVHYKFPPEICPECGQAIIHPDAAYDMFRGAPKFEWDGTVVTRIELANRLGLDKP